MKVWLKILVQTHQLLIFLNFTMTFAMSKRAQLFLLSFVLFASNLLAKELASDAIPIESLEAVELDPGMLSVLQNMPTLEG